MKIFGSNNSIDWIEEISYEVINDWVINTPKIFKTNSLEYYYYWRVSINRLYNDVNNPNIEKDTIHTGLLVFYF